MSFSQLAAELVERKKLDLYRQRPLLSSPQQPVAVLNGQPYVNFCSNDYLGLANDPDIIKSFQQAANDYGVGGGASHLVSGHSYHHHALEEELAEFTGRPRALLFSSGYMANLGVINALLSSSDLVVQDKLNHASLLDAGLLSGAKFTRYLHNDVKSLATRLNRYDAPRKLIVTDGVFSMDGDVAPLPEICSLAQQQKAWVMVDDAHGFGCLGLQGGGVAEHFNLDLDDLPILVGTLGKSFGTAGAFVAGSDVLIETLIQHARTYIYTTSMPPAVAAATRTSLKKLQAERWRRDKLSVLISRFRAGCEQLGLSLLNSDTPIQPLMVGSADHAIKISDELKQQGVFVTAIRPPTVPQGGARLRVTFSAAHTEAQVDQLLNALEKVSL